MPFKSQAQRRKFAELLVKGEISNETFDGAKETLAQRCRSSARNVSQSKTDCPAAFL